MSTTNAVPDGIRAIGWDYDVNPYTGMAISTYPPATTPVWALEQGVTPQVALPWTPLSYPAVGREPSYRPDLGPASAPAAALRP